MTFTIIIFQNPKDLKNRFMHLKGNHGLSSNDFINMFKISRSIHNRILLSIRKPRLISYWTHCITKAKPKAIITTGIQTSQLFLLTIQNAPITQYRSALLTFCLLEKQIFPMGLFDLFSSSRTFQMLAQYFVIILFSIFHFVM